MDNTINEFYSKQFTTINIEKFPFYFTLKDSFFFAGSCFSNNLAAWMKKRFFRQTQIPQGNIYNPVSLKKSLEMCFQPTRFSDKNIENHEGLYFHSDFHSTLSDKNRDYYRQSIQQALNSTREFLNQTPNFIFTLGTAYVYQRKSTGMVVNNCHHLNASEFIRRKLTLSEIVHSLQSINQLILSENSHARILYTLSPVRHLRDKATENSLSKALLRCAIEEIIDKTNVFYFPSYEIMLDELRDYRYYGADLSHPSELAVEYIMKRFSRSCFLKDELPWLDKLEKLALSLEHRAIQPESEKHQQFIKNRKNRSKELQSQFPYLQWPESI